MRLFWWGVAWLVGIVLGQLSALPAWVFVFGVLLAIAVQLLAEPWLRRLAPVVLLLSLGAFRMALAQPSFDQAHVSAHNNLLRPIVLTGVINADPKVRDVYVDLRVEAETLHDPMSEAPLPVEGLVLIQTDRDQRLSYGDRVQATGFLETPSDSGQFSYREFLARRGVHSLMPNASVTVLSSRQANPILQWIFDLRGRALESIHAQFPDPEASLLAGILLGIEAGISPEVQEAFNTTSTTHVIAISGFNLTILAALVIRLFGRWLGLRRGAVAAGLTIGLYTLLVGADAAVVRAAIMGGLALFARFLGRRAHGLASLSAAAMLMTALNPHALWDVGFQLSYAATLGLVLYADPIQQAFTRFARRWLSRQRAKRLARPVGEYLLFTLAAQLTTLPLTAVYFQRLSLISFLANPVILPAQPPLMVSGGLATMVGLVSQPLGKLVALVAWPFPAFTIRMVTWFSNFPSASIELRQVGFLTVALFYLCLFGATAYASLPAERRPSVSWIPRPSAAASVLALAAVSGMIWREALRRPDGMTHLTFFDSGSSLLETAEGRFILIGGGDSVVDLSQQLGSRIPLFHRELDWLIVMDTSEFRIRGLIDLVDRYRIRQVVVPGLAGGETYRRVLQELIDDGVPITFAAQGLSWSLDAQARLEVIEVGDTQLSLMLTNGRAQMVLLSDSLPLGEQAPLMPDSPTALIVHDPYPSDWLMNLDPLVSVAVGIPRDADDWQIRTAQHGWIEFTFDGEQLWLSSEHRVP
jgi:competence protein ComEC